MDGNKNYQFVIGNWMEGEEKNYSTYEQVMEEYYGWICTGFGISERGIDNEEKKNQNFNFVIDILFDFNMYSFLSNEIK